MTILLPRAADELKIPFVASGGMVDARSLVAALAMGAAGIPTVAELIDRIMADAERLIRNRLVGLLGYVETPAMKVA
jgi:NADH:quinone reductase (non-electrogenic)